MVYLLLLNYLLPVNKSKEYLEKENEFNKQDLNNILDEQILISQLSNGITFTDTNNMDIYERRYIIEKLMSLKKYEIEAKEKALEKMKVAK